MVSTRLYGIKKINIMLKIVAFLFQYYKNKKYSENEAYIRILGWVYAVIVIFLLIIFKLLDLDEVFKFLNNLSKAGRFLTFILISIPFILIFCLKYPLKKLKGYYGFFRYSKYYGWKLGGLWIVYLAFFVLIIVVKSN